MTPIFKCLICRKDIERSTKTYWIKKGHLLCSTCLDNIDKDLSISSDINKDINKYSEVIAEQQDRIDNVEKQLSYHDIRLSGQMDTLMVHRSRLEQIKTFLENM